MTHHEADPITVSHALELLTSHGFGGMAEALQLLLNEAMKLERSDYLRAAPYERSDARRGYANGFKPKTINSRLGSLRLAIPQVREAAYGEERFYPAA